MVDAHRLMARVGALKSSTREVFGSRTPIRPPPVNAEAAEVPADVGGVPPHVDGPGRIGDGREGCRRWQTRQ